MAEYEGKVHEVEEELAEAERAKGDAMQSLEISRDKQRSLQASLSTACSERDSTKIACDAAVSDLARTKSDLDSALAQVKQLRGRLRDHDAGSHAEL